MSSLDHRIGPPPVEALSDIRWARVERDLWAAVDRGEAVAPVAAPTAPARPRRTWKRVAAGAALFAAAAVVLLLAWPRPRSGAPHGDLPSRVVTATAPTTVSFGDAEITIAAESAMVLAGTPTRGVEIMLERGSAAFAVVPRLGRPPFVVHAGAVDIRVVGTRFTVARSGDAARVDVTHGEVEVVAHGQRVHVRAGDSWDSSRDREATTRSSAATTNPDDVVAARTLVDAGPASAPPPAEVPSPRVVSPPPPTAAELKAGYEAAAALEASDAAAALAAYRTLARGNGPWAANALYAAARLAATTDPALALKLARQYQQRFPRGANSGDAAQLIDRALGASHAPTP